MAALQGLLTTIPFTTATSLAYEERPPSAGLVKDSLIFVEGLQLDFKGCLLTQPTQHVTKHGYHQRIGNRLMFRSDNANDPAARDLPTFPHHKHLPSGLVAAAQPSLEQVLCEILSQLPVP